MPSSVTVKAVEPTWGWPSERALWSPYPRGGPWQIRMSVSAGIDSNFEARNDSPWRLGALNASHETTAATGCPRAESEQLGARVLKVVATQPVRQTPSLNGLVVVAGNEHDLCGRNPIEPLLELAREERLLGDEVALEREGDVPGDQQEVALGDVDQVLVEIGRADDPGHRVILSQPCCSRSDRAAAD